MTTITVSRELIEQAAEDWASAARLLPGYRDKHLLDLKDRCHAHVRALRAALAQQAEPSGWRPISTAPKDGTAVLLCWARNADDQPINWHDDPTTAGVFVQVASWWDGDNDWIVYCHMVREPRLHFAPTHWMPLPDAPKEISNG